MPRTPFPNRPTRIQTLIRSYQILFLLGSLCQTLGSLLEQLIIDGPLPTLNTELLGV